MRSMSEEQSIKLQRILLFDLHILFEHLRFNCRGFFVMSLERSVVPFALILASSSSRWVIVLIRIVFAALNVHEILLASVVVTSVD